MWTLSVPIWELIVRSVLVYGFLLVTASPDRQAPGRATRTIRPRPAARALQRRPELDEWRGQLADWRSRLRDTLVVLNLGIGAATYRSKRLEALIEGRPQIVIHNGMLYDAVLKDAKLTRHELNAALRQNGCDCVDDVHLAVLENNGSISVVPRKRGRPPWSSEGGQHGVNLKLGSRLIIIKRWRRSNRQCSTLAVSPPPPCPTQISHRFANGTRCHRPSALCTLSTGSRSTQNATASWLAR